MARRTYTPLLWWISYAATGIVFYLILHTTSDIAYPLHWVAWLYATIIMGILFGMHRLGQPISARLSPSGYLGLQTLLYTAGLVYGLVLVLALHFLILVPPYQLLQEVITRLNVVSTQVLASLASGKRPEYFTVEWAMQNLAPVFALLALIILLVLFGALLISYIEVLGKNREIQETRLRLLQSQMEPHFLFNALNTIAAEIRTHPEHAERLVVTLADFFRTVFDISAAETVPLKKEMELTERYLKIQKARFGRKLHYSIQADADCLTLKVPPLILQPLVENAIKHGWRERDQELQIDVCCRLENGHLRLMVTDNGCGFSREPKAVLQSSHSLGNIHQRLRMRFGHRYRLHIDSRKGQGTRITLQLQTG